MPSITAEKREQIRVTLKQLAEVNAATMQLLETMSSLLSLELALDPLAYLRSLPEPAPTKLSQAVPIADPTRFSIIYRGKACYLGYTLPFRLFARLVRRPNVYFKNEALLADVWGDDRSPEAIRSVVKILRSRLRRAGMKDLADAIDGSEPGHYALKLS